MRIYKVNTVPFCIEVATAAQDFEIENEATWKVLESSKNQHALGWQTKDGTYRVKHSDVRDSGRRLDGRRVIELHYGLSCLDLVMEFLLASLTVCLGQLLGGDNGYLREFYH